MASPAGPRSTPRRFLLNPHFHTGVLDGVFTHQPDGQLRFHPARAPTDRQVAELLAEIHQRIIRLLERRGIRAPEKLDGELDPLEDSSPALAGICAASVRGQVALGPRAGWPVMRVGNDPNAPWVTSRARRQAHLEGFDLHADVAVPSHKREGLEQLCRLCRSLHKRHYAQPGVMQTAGTVRPPSYEFGSWLLRITVEGRNDAMRRSGGWNLPGLRAGWFIAARASSFSVGSA